MLQYLRSEGVQGVGIEYAQNVQTYIRAPQQYDNFIAERIGEL